MNEVTQKEFAKLTGILPNHIRTYEKRMKIEVIPNGNIDFDNELNKHFYEIRRSDGKGCDFKDIVSARKEKVQVVDLKPKPESKPKPRKATKTAKKKEPVKKSTKSAAKTASTKADEKPKGLSELTRLQLDEKKLKLISVQREIELKEMQISKLHGLLIPTDLVLDTIKIQAESMKIAYHDANEKIIVMLSQRKKMNSNEISEIKTELIDVINGTIKASVTESKKSIRLIVNEYINKRGVGQRKSE